MLRPRYRIGDDVYIRQVVDDVGGEPILEVTREKVVTVCYKDGAFSSTASYNCRNKDAICAVFS